MNSIVKILSAVAVAGTMAAGGSAFTAGGLTLNPDLVNSTVGGTVVQNLLGGAVIDEINYGYVDDATQVEVDSIQLVFSGPLGVTLLAPTVILSDGAGTLADENVTCVVDAALPARSTWNCDPATSYAGLETLTITVTPAP
jgi:hypothetical protein